MHYWRKTKQIRILITTTTILGGRIVMIWGVEQCVSVAPMTGLSFKWKTLKIGFKIRGDELKTHCVCAHDTEVALFLGALLYRVCFAVLGMV
jgi:hypothetical protein